MGCVLVDLGFLSDIDTAKFEGFNEREIEFLINANKDVNTLNLRKKLKNVCPKGIKISNIARLNREFLKASFTLAE